MSVFVLGANGGIGRRVVARLANQGREVHGLVRDEDETELVASLGGTPHVGDVLEQESLVSGIEAADIVVHTATDLPINPPTTGRDWQRNDRVRLGGLDNVLSLLDSHTLEQIILPSVVWAVRDPKADAIDAFSQPNPDRTTESAIEAESRLQTATEGTATTATVLRLGWLYGADSPQTRVIGELLLEGDFPIIGRGRLGRHDTTISMLHLDDAADALVAAIDTGTGGTYHVVDEQPVTTAELFSLFAAKLGAPTPSRIPPWVARRFVGRDLVAFLTNPFPTSNTRFAQATDWLPTVPTVQIGLEKVIRTWLDQGFIKPTPTGYGLGQKLPAYYQCRHCGRSFTTFYEQCPHCKSPNRLTIHQTADESAGTPTP